MPDEIPFDLIELVAAIDQLQRTMGECQNKLAAVAEDLQRTVTDFQVSVAYCNDRIAKFRSALDAFHEARTDASMGRRPIAPVKPAHVRAYQGYDWVMRTAPNAEQLSWQEIFDILWERKRNGTADPRWSDLPERHYTFYNHVRQYCRAYLVKLPRRRLK